MIGEKKQSNEYTKKRECRKRKIKEAFDLESDTDDDENLSMDTIVGQESLKCSPKKKEGEKVLKKKFKECYFAIRKNK